MITWGILGDFSKFFDGEGDGDAVANDTLPAPVPVPAGVTNPPQPSSVWDDLANMGEAIWTSPNTILGLAAGLAGVPFGARPTFEHGAVVFNNYPWHGPQAGALTLGNTILSNLPDLTQDVPTYMTNYNANAGLPTPPNPMVNVGNHEEAHVRQAGILGPLYLPTYLAQSVFSNGPSPMEQAADTYGQTGKGWWPW